jgi:hypothetical protein
VAADAADEGLKLQRAHLIKRVGQVHEISPHRVSGWIDSLSQS